MKRPPFYILGFVRVLCCIALFVLVFGPNEGVAAYKTYIIVLDAMRGDYVGASYNGGAHNDADITPNLTWLKSQGSSHTVWDVMPAFTATNHVAIIASANAGKSGILGAGGGYLGMGLDSMINGVTYVHQDLHDRGVTKTLYNVAKTAGVGKTAVIAGKSWVADVFKDDDVNYKIYPGSSHGLGYITATSGYILGGVPHLPGDPVLNKPRVYVPSPTGGTLPQYCDSLQGLDADDFPSDAWVIKNAINVVRNMDPDLFYILLANMDEAGHAYGALFDGSVPNLHSYRNPDAVRDQVWITDSLVGVFIDTLQSIIDDNDSSRFDNSIIVLTADHGMSSMKSGSLAIDIRQVLEDSGFPMRLKDNHVNDSFNVNGVYDYCLTEGPTAYIYGIDSDIIDAMENLLKSNMPPVDNQNPVKGVYRGTAMNTMFGGPPNPIPSAGGLLWPDMMVVFKPNVCAYLYGDEIAVGANALHIEINVPPSFKDYFTDGLTVKSVPGEHGCHQERYVPCILTGGGVAKGMQNVPSPFGVSVGRGFFGELDPEGAVLAGGSSFWLNTGIAPAICELNSWSIPSTFSGGSILSSLPFFILDSDLISGEPEIGSVSSEFSMSSDLSGGGGWNYIGFDQDGSDGFSVLWDPNAFPKGDYLIRMMQFPMGQEKYAHIFSAPPGSGERLFHDNFQGGRIGNWIVSVQDGIFEPDSLYYKSSPWSLKMLSQSTGFAWGCTPNLNLDTTQDFTVATYFMIPNANNHWLVVLDNNWVHLVIDSGTSLKAWQGAYGGILPVASLSTGQWYWIRAEVHPQAGNYDIYLNGVYKGTANFLRDALGNVWPYLRVGDIHAGSTDHGGAYWDGIFVFGKRGEEPFLRGDANKDGIIDVGDVVYLINYLFKSGPTPDPLAAGDTNSDGIVDVGDVVYLINYLFKGGPAPSL